MSLTKKRDELIAEHKAMEKYDPHWKALAEKGDLISERPIAFVCNDEIVVVGDCVDKILEGLKRFKMTWDAKSEERDERMAREPSFAHAVSKVDRLLDQNPAEIRVPQQVWNGIVLSLAEVGILVCLSDGK